MSESPVWSQELGVRRQRRPASNFWLCASCFLMVMMALLLSGCVRIAGTAGYAKTNAAGETTVKKAGFDTNDLVPNGQVPGSITV